MKHIVVLLIMLGFTASAQTYNIEGRNLPGTWEFSYLAKTGPSAADTATVTGAIQLVYQGNPNATVQYPSGSIVLKMKLEGRVYMYTNILTGELYPSEYLATVRTGEKPDEIKADPLPNGKKWSSILTFNLTSTEVKDKKMYMNATLSDKEGNVYPLAMEKTKP